MYVYQIQYVKYGMTPFYLEYKSSRFLLNVAIYYETLLRVTQD